MRADTSLENKAYENLANAIIESAVNDYRKALKGVTYDKRIPPSSVIATVEKFFRSSDFGALTKLDGEYLISRLREEHETEKE